MRLALAVALFAAAPAAAADKPADLAVPGYRTQTVQGFTVLVERAVFDVPADKYAKKPLDVLDGELATICAVMKPDAVKTLRKLVLWAEWNTLVGTENGRAGVAVAVYRGGDAGLMARSGLHPLKARTVTVLNLKALTEEHQPGKDSGRCVLLHEFAHAVHDQILGMDNPAVAAGFAQAMERKLYDKGQYASTSRAEYFAELSCCYLDKLHYFPTTRAELKTHDPATFKLMETVWGGSAKKPAPAAAAAKAATDGSDRFDLSVTPDALRFGDRQFGPEVAADKLAGRVVLIGYYGGSQAAVLDKLSALNDELGGYGAAVIAASAYVRDADEIRADALARGATCTVLQGVFVPQGDGNKLYNQAPPHAMVFDPAGKCVFRGSAYAADRAARMAVAAQLAAAAVPGGLPAGLKPVTDAINSGTPPLGLLPKLAPLKASPDAATKAAATALSDAVLAPLVTAYEAAAADAKADPVAAFFAAEKVGAAGKGTAVGTKAQGLADRLKSDKAVAPELKARAALAAVLKLEALLRGQDGSFDPKNGRFRAKNEAALLELKRLTDAVAKKHPGTRAARQADRVAAEFGL